MRGARNGPIALALLTILWTGCGDDSAGNQNECPAGHRAEGPACAPLFDDPAMCPGPNEMPALGGGCRSVGVTACADGFVSDDEGGCAPILPPENEPCPPGTMERLGLTECQPVGVAECAQGFVSDGRGGCDAVLPEGLAPCAAGTIAQIGHGTCQPLGDCGPDPSQGGSPWGLIAVDGTTVYVDATADATGADGSTAAPFPTVAQAIAAVPSGGQVAIAAGDYEEALILSKPTRLVGRCSALVTLRGRVLLGQPRPALRIQAGATGCEVRGVTLAGPAEGVFMSGAASATIEEVEIRGTGSFGLFLESATEATLRRVVVAGTTMYGIWSVGATLRVEKSVIRDTLPQQGTDLYGHGITVQCSSPGVCGSLHLESSLLARNRDLGLFVWGGNATVTGSVVADTLDNANNHKFGRGISVQCDDLMEACGSLQLENCLVSGNRDHGLFLSGSAATVTSSVVTGTLSRANDQTSGTGIWAQCDEIAGSCGSVRVEGSLVANNRSAGVITMGPDLTVLTSIVRDTLPRESDDGGGRGISAQCDLDMGVCARLRVGESLVDGNHELGIASGSATTEVIATVVRDTLAQESDLTYGMGIHAWCDEHAAACGSLRVEGSVVAGNRELGIYAAGVDTHVVASVVRDTLPLEGGLIEGRGIGVQCRPEASACGSLHVEGSLVAGNQDIGIAIFGSEATVLSTVVRDTRAEESRQAAGRGINVQCDERLGACGSLLVEGCLVAGNRDMGIFSSGVDTSVLSSVVRDTLARQGDDALGRGIVAQCDDALRVCGHLAVTDSLVARNEDVGIFLYGVPVDLQGVAVIDTQTNEGGPYQGEHGQGIWSLCHPDTGDCGTVTMTGCLVMASHGAGVALEGVSGSMTGSLVGSVLSQPLDDKYGYGVQISGNEGEALPTFHVRESEIRDAKLVGVLYYRSTGTLSRTAVSGGEYSVAMNEGSSPTIAKDNRLSGSVESSPQWVSLYPSPAPPPVTPMEWVDPAAE